MFPDLYSFKRTNTKRDSVNGTTTFNFGASLDLGLTHSRFSLNGKRNTANACSSQTSRREVDSSLLDPSMDIELRLGNKKTQNEVKSSSLSFGEPDSINFNVDLELSLSIGAAESDVTSISLASSPLQASSDIQVLSSVVQLVDEGSASSKWRGSPLQTMHALQNMDVPVVMNALSNMNDLVSNAPILPSFNVGPLENPVSVGTPHPSQWRKTSVKTCQFPGCTKGARGASGHCISHGGGRRCKRPGCDKGAEGKTAFCKAHGGGRRCEYLGCMKSAEGRTNLCIAHGGGRRCSYTEGCTRAARGRSNFCIRHGGGKRCSMENCSKSAEGLSGLCIGHGGGHRCQHPECNKGAQGSTKFCKAHGGGKRCTFLGCNKGAEGSTLFCKAHGGGKRCSFEGGCTKSVHGGTLFCVAHGGGKRCAVPDCTKSARGKTNFCVRHGGGKRCKHDVCTKSAQGSTDFCKAHGGGRRSLWGQPDSHFGMDGASTCDKFAKGNIGLCAAQNAQLHDKCVHGCSNAGHLPYELEPTISRKGKEVATTPQNVPFKGTYNISGWNAFAFGGDGHYSLSMHIPSNCNLLIPEGRVHGGSLMAMLSENLVSLGPSTGNQTVGSPSEPVARSWV